MRIFTIVIMVIALGLIALNVTKLDFNNIFEGDSGIALIGIIACLCVIVLMLVFRTSKAIQDKIKNRK
ncbi:hypothetical protein [Spongiivirga citrea]|uniref:Uncharacterized protein n=1 Tax=Spongiivirga citrea TaxID=1481457 RepID=A0A6M0CN09_9FLAO|nr:hypothetical protein [Spongiivirga citrea]NER19072.1 hypothetical protein [Spongiivirga citrea]